MAGLSSNEGEFATSTTTSAPASACDNPSAVSVFTPLEGDAATTSCPRWLRLFTTFVPMSPVPPTTMIFFCYASAAGGRIALADCASLAFRCHATITPAAAPKFCDSVFRLCLRHAGDVFQKSGLTQIGSLHLDERLSNYRHRWSSSGSVNEMLSELLKFQGIEIGHGPVIQPASTPMEEIVTAAL